MLGSTFFKLVLCGLLAFLAAVPAQAQNKVVVSNIVFVGDLSDIAVGTVRPMQVNIQSNIGSYTGEAILSNHTPSDYYTPHIGFSTSLSGPFTSLLSVPFSLQNGNAWTPIFYVKAISPAAITYIQACSAVGCGDSPYLSVTGATPPPPPNQPSALVVASYDKLSVGSIATMRLQVNGLPGSFGGFADTYQVTADLPGAMLFSLSLNGPFLPVVGVPIQVNGSGEGQSADFYVKGKTANFGDSYAPQATSHVVGCASALPCLTPRTMRVVNVIFIWWQRYSEDNEGISDDPRVTHGKRIFVGKRTPGDTAASDRRKVRVRAFLNEPIAGVRVRFRLFDPDDPTTNDPVLDPNGPAGDDNRGVGATLLSTTAITDEDGEASVVLSVSSQPGDNFQVAASAEAPSNGWHWSLASLEFPPAGNGFSVAPAVATERLTVWRRLHIERDAMDMVTGNYLTGTVTSVAPDPDGGSRLGVSSLLEYYRFDRGRIELQIPGSGLAYSYDVVWNSDNKVMTKTPVPLVTGWRFKLFDDDDFNEDDTLLDGDEGEKVPFPDMSLLADSDDPAKNRLAAAFIRPTYDLAKGFAPFAPNTPAPSTCGLLESDLGSQFVFDNQASEADPEYWTIYALGAYQGVPDEDWDPDGFDGAVGAVDDLNGKGFALYHEDHADFLRMCALEGITPPPFNEHANTAVHEVGHLFWGEHEDGGILGHESAEYSAVTLDKIRSADHP